MSKNSNLPGQGNGIGEEGSIDMKEIAKREKRPQYFSFFLECCEMISILEDESAGKVIHAIADYFCDGEDPQGLSKPEQRAFNRIKREVDKSCEIWLAKVKGGRNRWT